MKTKRLMGSVVIPFVLLGFVFTLFSYFFVDANLVLSHIPIVQTILGGMRMLFLANRGLVAGLYVLLLAGYFFVYFLLLKNIGKFPQSFRYGFIPVFISVYTVLVFSYPATSYDLFNYMATAKVTFIHKENPYVVMPIDIANDPILAYTRAANKTSLYGPVWIAMTSAPILLGGGNVWVTMVLFRVVTILLLLFTSYILFRLSDDLVKPAFFALNPLVILEVGSAGHNDIAMISFLLLALFMLFGRKTAKRGIAYGSYLLSVLVKGVTIVVLPFLFFRFRLQTLWRLLFWVLFTVFVVAAPIREELYPWYAVWFLPFAALLDNRKFEKGFAIALSVGLELRHVPYMVMGYYEGYGPMLRIVCTILPLAVYFLFLTMRKKRSIL